MVCTALDQCHTAGTCQPGTGTCTNPVKPTGTSCNDDLFCTINDQCIDGNCVGGGEYDCSEIVGPCMEGICDEDNDTCILGDPKDPGTDCEPCGECDGEGNCLGSAGRDGDLCDDDDDCTGTGICRYSGACVIEGWCEEILPECPEPAARYAPDLPDCRLPEDKVALEAEIPHQKIGYATPFSMLLRLSNNPENSRSGEAWVLPLRQLRILIETQGESPDESPAVIYLAGSARLEGGGVPVEEEAGSEGLVSWQVIDPLDVLLVAEPWQLSLALQMTGGSFSEATLKLWVEAPCSAAPGEIGCHDEEGWQRVSGQLLVPIVPGVMVTSAGADSDGQRVVGCECGGGELKAQTRHRLIKPRFLLTTLSKIICKLMDF
ncbi:hypothetical protein HXY33_06595 [Candidatus Bathyarchaeota archaeon]|nr:hypothetical protein [Candidatus Bathyarchaeota archaeon]